MTQTIGIAVHAERGKHLTIEEAIDLALDKPEVWFVIESAVSSEYFWGYNHA